MKIFLFIRGLPASGKITVARELEKKLGWRVLWIHAIKNAIYDVVQEHRIPELMREVLEPIARFLLEKNLNIIYVRPSSEQKNVDRMSELVAKYPGYEFHLVTLVADETELVRRAVAREDAYRISNEKELKEYLARQPELAKCRDDELCIDTTHVTPGAVVKKICAHFGYTKSNV